MNESNATILQFYPEYTKQLCLWISQQLGDLNGLIHLCRIWKPQVKSNGGHKAARLSFHSWLAQAFRKVLRGFQQQQGQKHISSPCLYHIVTVSLAKASQIAKPRLRVEEPYSGHRYRREENLWSFLHGATKIIPKDLDSFDGASFSRHPRFEGKKNEH